MEIKGDLYVLLHSQTQGCFHIEKMGVMLRKNVNTFLSGNKVDYIPLAIAATIDELEEMKANLIEARAKVVPFRSPDKH
ncbi:hypothetical protein [Limnobaculum xujianqingii]|uniref:hypothetical protein n=1 Tax=Limnobaculum xujianqingii TaxID=2738837 RepID=UPI001127BBEB|nr:hypothetical protein [Limnobaculum xujianqingii]